MIKKEIMAQVLYKISLENKDLSIKLSNKLDSKVVIEDWYNIFKNYNIKDYITH